MSLLKLEDICKSCNTQYILCFNKDDLNNLSCCPFCSYPIAEDSKEEDEEHEE